ncbi:hypothetical protein PWT90_05969 [Aphanocladium album]|nr:hypothetical protein PWT90_05969 [Aphanocladium album]
MEVTILHFNDVYHISDSELVAKFASVFKDPSLVTGSGTKRDQHVLRIFSGDAFSPSLEAAVLRGDHMAPLLDSFDIDVACFGNHDFDFGEDRLRELTESMRFPWTLTNATAVGEGGDGRRLLASAKEYVIRDIAGYRFGFFGLAGSDWPSNCQHLPECTIADPARVAHEVTRLLRRIEKCDIVIAVTHMRLTEDMETLHRNLDGPEGVDLILGGHDHHVVRRGPADTCSNPEILQSGVDLQFDSMAECSGDFRIIKSGVDWRGLSILRLKLGTKEKGKPPIVSRSLQQIQDLKEIPNYDQIPMSQTTLSILKKTQSKIEQVVTQPLLRTTVPLDGRMNMIRSQETNLGNMLADAVRAFYDTDIGLVNSGAVRCDRVVKCESDVPLCIRDVIEVSPFDNAFVVKRVSGQVLARALENSVSDAHTDGRFLQLCGLSMSLDWRLPEGSRVSEIRFHPNNGKAEPLDPDRMYTVTMVDFIGSGFDGYNCFRDCETLVDKEGAITDTNMLLEIFKLSRKDGEENEMADQHAEGIQRARAAIISGHHAEDGLPMVGPKMEDRIKIIGKK